MGRHPPLRRGERACGLVNGIQRGAVALLNVRIARAMGSMAACHALRYVVFCTKETNRLPSEGYVLKLLEFILDWKSIFMICVYAYGVMAFFYCVDWSMRKKIAVPATLERVLGVYLPVNVIVCPAVFDTGFLLPHGC